MAYPECHSGGGGEGSKCFWKSGGPRLLGKSGAMLPENIFKNGAIWCVLENILLKFCKKKIVKIFIFLYKNNR